MSEITEGMLKLVRKSILHRGPTDIVAKTYLIGVSTALTTMLANPKRISAIMEEVANLSRIIENVENNAQAPSLESVNQAEETLRTFLPPDHPVLAVLRKVKNESKNAADAALARAKGESK